MNNLKNLIADKKKDISSCLDLFMLDVKKAIEEKNNKIIALNSLPKFKIILFSNIDILIELKNNNKTFKKIINNIIKIKKENKKLKNSILENSEKNIIDTKNMTAFKIIALDLEEKEKLIKKKDDYIKECEYKITKLEENISILNGNNGDLKKEIETLNKKNNDLNNINTLQSRTIETLQNELKSKNEKIDDLKEGFMTILNKYNDILIEEY